MEQEFNCFKGNHQIVVDAKLTTLRNGRKAWTAKCPEHKNNLFKFMKSETE